MEDIFIKLVREGITPNSYYILHCIKNGIIPCSFVNKDLTQEQAEEQAADGGRGRRAGGTP